MFSILVVSMEIISGLPTLQLALWPESIVCKGKQNRAYVQFFFWRCNIDRHFYHGDCGNLCPKNSMVTFIAESCYNLLQSSRGFKQRRC